MSKTFSDEQYAKIRQGFNDTRQDAQRKLTDRRIGDLNDNFVTLIEEHNQKLARGGADTSYSASIIGRACILYSEAPPTPRQVLHSDAFRDLEEKCRKADLALDVVQRSRVFASDDAELPPDTYVWFRTAPYAASTFEDKPAGNCADWPAEGRAVLPQHAASNNVGLLVVAAALVFGSAVATYAITKNTAPTPHSAPAPAPAVNADGKLGR
jgi:hypothetical protein